MTALAVDPSTKRLYAVWVRPTTPGHEAVSVWTRSAAGTWSGPTDVAASGQFTGPASVVAAGGKVYVAFTAQDLKGPCDDSGAQRRRLPRQLQRGELVQATGADQLPRRPAQRLELLGA